MAQALRQTWGTNLCPVVSLVTPFPVLHCQVPCPKNEPLFGSPHISSKAERFSLPNPRKLFSKTSPSPRNSKRPAGPTSDERAAALAALADERRVTRYLNLRHAAAAAVSAPIPAVARLKRLADDPFPMTKLQSRIAKEDRDVSGALSERFRGSLRFVIVAKFGWNSLN